MRRYSLTRDAEADLFEIGRYAEDRWGVARSRAYLDALEGTIEKLSVHPLLGQVRDELIVGYRSFPVGSHQIFYRFAGPDIEIVRILHARMDPARHLDPDGEDES